jgi:hypothetical protein
LRFKRQAHKGISRATQTARVRADNELQAAQVTAASKRQIGLKGAVQRHGCVSLNDCYWHQWQQYLEGSFYSSPGRILAQQPVNECGFSMSGLAALSNIKENKKVWMKKMWV